MAQDDIQGQVVDPSGNPVSGAIVELTRSYESNPVEEQTVLRTTTDSNGNYIFEAHPDGDGTTQDYHVSCYNYDGTAYVNSNDNPGVSAALPSNAIPDSALTQDLVAWYRFEDGDARDYASNAEFSNVTWGDSTAYDGTVNGATFQSSGGVTDFVNGGNSGAFDFDGTDDFIAGAPGNFANNLTVMCWFKGSGAGSGSEFFQGAGLVNSERLGAGQGDFGIAMFADGRLVVGVGPRGAAVNFNIRSSATGFDDGSYHHIAFSWSNNGTLSLYIDGSFDNSKSVPSGELNESPDIGRTPVQNIFYTGLIDDVRLYDAELSGSEISAIFQETAP